MPKANGVQYANLFSPQGNYDTCIMGPLPSNELCERNICAT